MRRIAFAMIACLSVSPAMAASPVVPKQPDHIVVDLDYPEAVILFKLLANAGARCDHGDADYCDAISKRGTIMKKVRDSYSAEFTKINAKK